MPRHSAHCLIMVGGSHKLSKEADKLRGNKRSFASFSFKAPPDRCITAWIGSSALKSLLNQPCKVLIKRSYNAEGVAASLMLVSASELLNHFFPNFSNKALRTALMPLHRKPFSLRAIIICPAAKASPVIILFL